MNSPLVAVSDLRVRFPTGAKALDGINFTLARGETLAVVGESGAGKSTLANCLLGLVQPPAASGSVLLSGRELIGASETVLRSVRWSTAALVPQGSALNPVVRIGDQIAEPLREHAGLAAADARRRAAELAQDALLDPALLDSYPHELSGGQRRHALLAMALALGPALLVLDEPTAGADPAARAALLDRIGELAHHRGHAVLVVTHDLSAAMRVARRCMVLYAGQLMEAGDTDVVLGRPAHPYSRGLLSAYPVMTTTKDLRPLRGHPPDAHAVPSGCAFHPRCTQAEAICSRETPQLETSRGRLVGCHFGGLKTLLRASGLHKTFRSGSRQVRAVDGISFVVEHGEAVGVAGSSGSGKTTLARLVTGHLAADAGEVVLHDEPLPRSWSKPARQARRQVQLLMQDPWDALSPRLSVRELVREPLDLAVAGDTVSAGDVPAVDDAVDAMLEAVGLRTSGGFLASRVHELSGGQLQRIALARALLARPKLLVADEPTSMLDASEQARLLVVLRERQVELGLGLVLVSHDLAILRKVTDRIVVLDRGRVVEEGASEQVSTAPLSRAARALVAAAPALGPAAEARQMRLRDRDLC